MHEQGGRGIYIYDMWLSLAIKNMALHATPLEFLPHATRTIYALASEIGLLVAGHACVLARALHRGSKNNSGNWRCRMSVVRWMHVGGAKSIGLFAIQKKYDRKTALWAVVASKLDSRMFIVLLRGKSEGWTNKCHERTHGTEQGPFSDCFRKTYSERR